VRKLLMSGDNRTADYNEPAVMRQAALRLGVPDADIVLDFAGRSTYETCYRARDIFGLSDAVLVTQEFHLDRAMLICDALGVQTDGFVADRRAYRSLNWYQFREIAATLNALVELYLTRPLPVLGEKLPIE
jgi:SanA protein